MSGRIDHVFSCSLVRFGRLHSELRDARARWTARASFSASTCAPAASDVERRPARREPLKVLVFLCDGGQKYVSKIFKDDGMRENGFLEAATGIGIVADILHMRNKRKIVTTTTSSAKDVIVTLKQLGISQLPSSTRAS